MMVTCRLVAFVVLLAGICCYASNLQTLRTFHTQACDGATLRLECWPNTVLSVYAARYGREHDTPCLPASPVSNCTASANVLSRVEDECKKQRTCQLQVSGANLGADPCPGHPKFLDVAYKCRPSKFFHKFACEGDKLRLRCPKDFRIVVYSASFGASPAGSPQCPQAVSSTECQAAYVTETLIKECHGRRKCSLTTDLATLGDPGCDVAVEPFLKVIYTCVPQDTLKEQEMSEEEELEENRVEMVAAPHYSGITEADEEELTSRSTTPPDIVIGQDTGGAPVEVNCTQSVESQAAGFLAEWISVYAFIRGNKEQFYLYLTLSLTTSFLVFLAAISARLYFQRRRSGHRAISETVVNHEQDVEGLSFTRATPTLRRTQLPSSPRTAHSNSYYS